MGGKGQGEKGAGDENTGLCKLQTKEAGLSLNSYFGNTQVASESSIYGRYLLEKDGPDRKVFV